MRKLNERRRRAGGVTLAAASAAVLVALALFAGAGQARPAAAPVNTTPPSIDGAAREGNVVTADPGKWTGRQPITFSGQWKRCDAKGNACAVIQSVTEPDYRVTAQDVGHTLRITVVAKNPDGQTTATSRATAVVTAAPAQAPSNTSPPTISGTPQDGQRLAGDPGQWTGTQPIRFDYQWDRCDKNGSGCGAIRGADDRNYTLVPADIGSTVRLRVVAQNSRGRSTAFSRPSGVVTAKGPVLPPGAIRLGDGKYSIPVTSVSPPERLVVSQLNFQPNPLRSRNDTITARFRVTDTRGYVVRDALVFVIPLPYGWTTQPAETATAQDGWASVSMRATPRLPRKAAIVMFVRARKAGDSLLAGVSSRRLVQMLVNIG
ncbi:MAG: hypothetical protein ABR521_03270 [Gaiellaceae bacterium]